MPDNSSRGGGRGGWNKRRSKNERSNDEKATERERGETRGSLTRKPETHRRKFLVIGRYMRPGRWEARVYPVLNEKGPSSSCEKEEEEEKEKLGTVTVIKGFGKQTEGER